MVTASIWGSNRSTRSSTEVKNSGRGGPATVGEERRGDASTTGRSQGRFQQVSSNSLIALTDAAARSGFSLCGKQPLLSGDSLFTALALIPQNRTFKIQARICGEAGYMIFMVCRLYPGACG